MTSFASKHDRWISMGATQSDRRCNCREPCDCAERHREEREWERIEKLEQEKADGLEREDEIPVDEDSIRPGPQPETSRPFIPGHEAIAGASSRRREEENH